jgi:hypothetical protein
LKAVVREFFYIGANDSLSKLYPDMFMSVPPESLALAATAVSHLLVTATIAARVLTAIQVASTLDEYSTGLCKRNTFAGATYYSVYKKIMKGIKRTQADPYHGPKLQAMLQEWADEARLVRKHLI